MRAWMMLGFLALGVAQATQAAKITSFSPQGEVGVARQVRAEFSEPMVRLGDAKAPAPFEIDCRFPGAGRWAGTQTWIFDFERDLLPGSACRFRLRADLRSATGQPVTGTTAFAFRTGGPAVARSFPYAQSSDIDEEQVFVLLLTGPATEATIRANTWCEAENLGERIPTEIVGGTNRDTLLKQFKLEAEAERVVMLHCRQRLQNGSRVSLVWGRGIAATGGLATTREQRLAFTVRANFEASFSCERESAQSPCVPVRPVTLAFSAPVPRAHADGIRLRTRTGEMKPRWARGEGEAVVSRIEIPGPFPESSEATLELPKDFRDETGRALANAASFPLRIRIGAAPPLARFPATFGIVEAGAAAALPITVRRLEQDLAGPQATGVPLRTLRVDGDAGVIAWMRKLHGRGFDFERPAGCLSPEQEAAARARGEKLRQPEDCRQAREVSLLAGEAGAERRTLPLPGRGQSFEVVGIPFDKPGYYVVELESPALGAALLGRAAPMYVRASVLVTNLAVHYKAGRDNALVWVTALDTGKPVADAEVRVWDCQGKPLWRGTTDRSGVAAVPEAPVARGSCQSREREEWTEPAVFISASRDGDHAFVLSTWNGGIERWRFGVPTAFGAASPLRAHTVFDRTLLRAGETVSMKHFVRRESREGFASVDPRLLPDRVRIRHVGSDQEILQPLRFRNGAAETRHVIPRDAPLGEYEVALLRGSGDWRDRRRDDADGGDETRELATGTFRVSEFRLPVLEGRVVPPKAPQVAPREVPYELQLNYVGGGPAANQELRISSTVRARDVSFPGFEGFRFVLTEREEGREEGPGETLIADRVAVKLDRNGAGRVSVGNVPPATGPRFLRTEASFFDPNGERLTISNTVPLWPAEVVVGIRAEDWVAVGRQARTTLVVLDTTGKPVAGVTVDVHAEARTVISHRRRLVGGFYAYEHRTETKALGEVCSGRSDARGLVLCDVELAAAGNVVLVARAKDTGGRVAQADTSVWVTERGEVWFESESQDRMDLVPEKRRYEAGETARLQLRMPFRSATALVSVEREGVIETFVREVSGRNPVVEVPIRPGYGPNVFVSALVVRGRLREVPWYSAFIWGWRSPIEWWRAWREWREKGTPGAMVDLAKPAFKYGVTELQVGIGSHELKVSVTPARDTYRVRERASVKVQVRMPDGKPVARGTEVAFAAVDQALLELEPNLSWKLLEGMYQRRGYAVETATAQMQVVGRRHFGKKAVTHGGGGGRLPGRELFDTLLLWHPRVVLDANGEATLEVPINDSLTRFALVAVAAAGTSYFGTGTGSLRVAQDLQLIAGLPPVVRSGDSYRAAVTLRNTAGRPMRVRVEATAGGARLAPRLVEVPAGEAREAAWQVAVPEDGRDAPIPWQIEAREEAGATRSESPARDVLRLVQKRAPLVPVTVQQASLVQLAAPFLQEAAAPAGALAGRGGVQVSLQPRVGVLPAGIRSYFEAYPFVCLEQKASRAIGLRDRAQWQKLIDELPGYLDNDGLARYFPGDGPGSDVLTAYLLAASHEAGYAIPAATLDRMHTGLLRFVEGRIERRHWSPRADLDARKLAAIEALARRGHATARHLESIAVDPAGWPTGALVDWLAILARLPSIADHAAQRARADQVLRARLDFTGTRLGFTTEQQDEWWWLMTNADANGARLILTLLDVPGWREDLPRLVNGLIGRQSRGRWATTTANVWGSLALEKFSAAFESTEVRGRTTVALGDARQALDWREKPAGGNILAPWGAAAASRPAPLRIEHGGTGAPWATIASLAAVPVTAPQAAGFALARTVEPVEQKQRGAFSRGDIVRVRIAIDVRSDATWVVVTDPVPAGASILGTGLGRDSAIATSGERRSGQAVPVFEERGQESFRAYYEYLPKGRSTLEYTLRLNNEGAFGMPATRVEAMYAPEMFGELPNAKIDVGP